MKLGDLWRVAILGMLAASCGDKDDVPGDGPSGSSGTQDPCKPHCDGADDKSYFQSGQYQSVTCVWYCRGDKYISETYENRGGCYDLASRYTSDPICD